ncbi:MAG: amino acid adenylation domain-containing protein [Opitutaceae bacterium]|nr:amino acid adenylation domain-containing protein [Opitutaceae bacterium]
MDDRKALLDLLLAEEGLETDAELALGSRKDSGAPAALSFAQQRLWFLDQFEPGGAAYSVPGALRLRGELDRAALRLAWAGLGDRHDVLRTVFVAVGDEPAAELRPGMTAAWAEEDLGGLDAGAREVAVSARLTAEVAVPFALADGPLLRARLLRLSAKEHVLAVTMHHIISDQWSLGLLATELAAGYAAARGEGPVPSRPAVQYADFAEWQRRWSETPACQDQLDYWRGQLAAGTALELQTDFPRPAQPSARGGTAAFTIPAADRVALEAIGKEEAATEFMGLLAVFKVLLHRYTGQTNVAVGSPVTGRARAETAPLIGFFTNTLVLRTAVEGSESFRASLRAVKATCLAAYAAQDVPFELLAEALQPTREMNRNPFFDVMFVHQTELPELTLPGVVAEFLPTTIPEAKFDLTLTVRDRADGGLDGWIEYRADLFTADSMARMAGHFTRLVAGAGAEPEAALLDLPMLGEKEHNQVVHDFNATAMDWSGAGEPLLHRLVEAAAARTPDKVALIDEWEQITYAELEERTNQLGHHLQGLGIGPDVIVGLYLGRTLDMIVGVLGVMKAGGCYLPLDPGYPADRLEFMMEDSGAPVVITHQESRGKLTFPAGVMELDLDRVAEELKAHPATPPRSDVSGENLSYIIYTSGSTGKPKGTTLGHAAMCNLIRWHHDTLLTGARGLFFASLSFDVSFHDTFAVLGSGGELHIASELMRGDSAVLVDYLESARIEKVILPVVVWQQLAADYGDRPERFASLRELITTGEALILTPAILALSAQMPDCVMHNHYGPSETHVVTAHTFDGPPSTVSPPPPIGRPIANTQIYLLDSRMNPVPVGVPGELYIGGANLGRDYHGRPDLTAERFGPNPFGTEAGERLYRPGDRARWLADGSIEFFGRLDDQVKIRGFRVELGEVESRLVQHPAVTGAVVVVRERTAGDKCLVGFFTREAEVPVTVEELRGFVGERLPNYMVPAVFVELEALPLTPSGKIHRSGLPELEVNQMARDAAYEAPKGEGEWLVADVWAELLGVERVGRADHFFHLGGHSLLATRVIARLRSRTTMPVPLRALFEHPTLADFAAACGEAVGGADIWETVAATVREVEAMSDDEAARLQEDG